MYTNNIIAKNAFFNIISKLANIFFPLITSIYVSHILFAEGIGKVGYAQNVSQYFILIAPLGTINYGTRELAKIRNCKDNVNILFTELFMINFGSTILCSLIYYGMIIAMPYFADEKNLFFVAGIPIVFNIFNVEWFYQGIEDYIYISLRNIIVKVISFGLVIFFVRTSKDYVIYALIYSVGIAGNYLFNINNLTKYEVKFVCKKIYPLRHLKSIFVFLASTMAVEIYTLLDTTMLGYMCDDVVVGYYTNAIKLNKMIVGVVSAIGAVLLPRFSIYLRNGEIEKINYLISKIIMIIIFLVIPAGVGIFIIADKLVVLLFGQSFLPAILTVRIGTILIYILAFSNLFGTQVLLSFGQEKKLLVGTCVGALINFIMNFFLIQRYQHNGAMIASVVSELIVVILFFYMILKYIEISVGMDFLWKTIMACESMGIIVYLISNSIKNLMVNVVLSVVIGVLIYLLVSFLLKNPIIYIFRKKSKSFFH